jgi:hypothetical protein
VIMKSETPHPHRGDRRHVHLGGRRRSDFNCAVTCAYCGDATGRAFNIRWRCFYWTCAKCARTELIVLPTDDADTLPASVVLWTLQDPAGASLACSIVLRPGDGFELRVMRGHEPITLEPFGDPNVLLDRSREIRARLLEDGCAQVDGST